LKPLPPDLPRVDSIGMNFLLHCLPGPMANKTRAVAHLAPLLSPGGVLFGSTILVKGRQHGRLGRFVLRLYNARILPKCRVFDNLDDGADDVEAMLKAHFQEHRLEIVGHVALFAGFA
jgi:hypothetical protein